MSNDMRERILAAATELFDARGINSTGVDTIVAEAGIAKMTLYKYFHTKEALVLEVLTRRSRAFSQWLSSRLEKSAADPSQKLQLLFDGIEEWLADPQCSGLPFLKASAEFPQQDSAVHRLSAELSREFRDYITGLVRESGIIPAEPLGLQLAMLIEGAVLSEQLAKGSGALDQARQAARILIESARR